MRSLDGEWKPGMVKIYNKGPEHAPTGVRSGPCAPESYFAAFLSPANFA